MYITILKIFLLLSQKDIKYYIYSRISGRNISDFEIYKMRYSNPRRFFKSLSSNILASKFFINISFWIFIWQNKIIEDINGSHYALKNV